MRTVATLNRAWRYIPAFDEAFVSSSFPVESWEEVCLPHTNKELPYNGFDERDYQFVSCYARDLEIPPLAGGMRAFLDFEAVMGACRVFAGGRLAGSHVGGYTPFSVELTGFAEEGGLLRIAVEVDSTERPDLPPFGHVVDYLCHGGIYRGVSLRLQEDAILRDCFARPLDALSGLKRLELDIEVDSKGGLGGLVAACALMDGERLVGGGEGAVRADGSASISLTGLGGLRTWDLDSPAMYDLVVSLSRDGRPVDSRRIRVGWREAVWRADGFRLNGRKLHLVGLNRHQSYPYVGYAMPARAQRRDAIILKRELGVNMVRESHYPQSPDFLDACDELGLLVFEELPGWAHIGGATWKENALRSLEEMIRRDRNRPSVVIWGVRINESRDDHDFYTATNALARRLDPTRATGGVRCIPRSELLEDVYTFNDFTHEGHRAVLGRPRRVTGLHRRVPYLVTEHTGHMYPTKRFDNEDRLVEHTLRHLRVMEAARATPGIAGALGWCAFDYNTHKDFGSGDRICYHGVMDMFRLPKHAAAAYAAQRPVAEGVVLEAASIFAKGERESARQLPLVINTNCDEVALFRGGARIGAWLPAREEFPHLPHPPVIVRDLIGDQLEETVFRPRDRARMKRVIGKVMAGGMRALGLVDYAALAWILLRYRMTMIDAEALVGKYTLGWGSPNDSYELVGLVGGKEVARRTYGGDAHAARLALAADDSLLSKGDWDTTRLVLRLEDQYGNLYPFAAEAVELELSGPGGVIGPTRLSLIGGCIAFWLRSSGEPGEISVRARGTRFSSEWVRVQVE